MLTNNDVLEYKGMEECLLNDPDSKHCIYHLISIKEVLGKKEFYWENRLMDAMFF